MKGGKRMGAGRPKLQDRPKPTSWRPDNEFIKAEYKRLGGSKWLNTTIASIIKDKKKP